MNDHQAYWPIESHRWRGSLLSPLKRKASLSYNLEPRIKLPCPLPSSKPVVLYLVHVQKSLDTNTGKMWLSSVRITITSTCALLIIIHTRWTLQQAQMCWDAIWASSAGVWVVESLGKLHTLSVGAHTIEKLAFVQLVRNQSEKSCLVVSPDDQLVSITMDGMLWCFKGAGKNTGMCCSPQNNFTCCTLRQTNMKLSLWTNPQTTSYMLQP